MKMDVTDCGISLSALQYHIILHLDMLDPIGLYRAICVRLSVIGKLQQTVILIIDGTHISRKFFEGVEDTFELQRGLNNCFAYDLVPGVPIIEAALKAARRLNDFPTGRFAYEQRPSVTADSISTACRVLEGVKEKVENPSQYKVGLAVSPSDSFTANNPFSTQAYLDEFAPLMKELGEFRHMCC